MAKPNMTKFSSSILAYLIFVLSLSLTGMNTALAGGLNASLSTSQLVLGDSFTLKLSSDAGRRSPPDLSPLQKDFEILGSSQSSQTTIINGARTDSLAWLITLSPRAIGKTIIPALKAGNLSSDPVTIEVLDASSMPAGLPDGKNLSIEARLEPGTHYVHEEIPLTVTITEGAGARELQLSEPSSDDFTLKQSGEDKVYQTDKNGAIVNVIERKYILQPQKSGSLTVPSLVLRARVNDPNARRSPFGGNAFASVFGGSGMSSPFFDDLFNPGRQVVVSSKPLVIDIESRPTGDDNWFLPARDVQLHATWEPANPVFRVGEAVTRRLQLLALGASQEQLPDIQLTQANGARIYVDRSNNKSIDTDRGTVAMREFITSVVPTGAGKISLPAIEVKWWDTDADVARVATLPAEFHVVQGGSPVPATSGGSKQVGVNSSTEAAQPVIDKTPTDSIKLPWLWLTVVAVAVLAMIGIGLRKLANRRLPARGPDSLARNPSAGLPVADKKVKAAQALKTLESACKKNDRAAAYAACIAWLNLVFGARITNPSRLDEISPTLAQELASMERALYAQDDDSHWSGDALLRLVVAVNRQASMNKSSHGGNRILPPLYPPVVRI